MLVATIISACLTQCPVEVDISATTPEGLSGTSVAVDGDLAVIGCPIGTGNGWASGTALVYRFINNIWVREAELIAEDGAIGDMMGVSVDVSGGRVVAGAWFNNHAGTNSGAAYIFEQIDGKWLQTTKLIADDASTQDSFGRRVAIEGDICVVTAPLDDDNGESSGSAYVYQYDGSWSQLQKLSAGTSGDQFGLGLALAMYGERIVIGAPWATDGRGKSYIYDRGDATFFKSAILSDPEGEPMDSFGFGLAVDGNFVAAGSYLDDDVIENGGSIFMFTKNGNEWELAQRIEPASDAIENNQFGVSISIDNGVMLVGNRFAQGTGSVSVFDLVDGLWGGRSTIVSPQPTVDAEFGWAVSHDGEHALIGEPWLEPDGEAHFFNGFITSCDCVGDLNGDLIVGVSDLLQVIDVWGNCDGCSEDLDGDGFVDVSDLLQIISLWGGCV